MRRIGLFCEDFAHESFITPLIRRFSSTHNTDVEIRPISVTGGRGTVVTELHQYLRDLGRQRADWLDLLVVATDANCKSVSERISELALQGFEVKPPCALAIPDPHIERWMLLDPPAVGLVLGVTPSLAPQKCERGLYKRLLAKTIREAGLSPILGGMEYARDIVNALDLDVDDKSFARLVRDLRTAFQQWSSATPP
jgi:hypothetical protein